MDVRNVGSKKTAEAEGAVNTPLITTPISSKTKLSKNSKNAITYCMSLFEDYVSNSSCKFSFKTIRCYYNFLYCCLPVIFILFVVITLYQCYGVDISYINNILC